MLQVEMSADVRTVTGKGAMRQLRMAGKTPAIMYGIADKPVALTLDSKRFTSQLLEIARRNAVITLKVDGSGEKSVLVREIQTEPVKDTLVHVDFLEIDLEVARTFTVPIAYTGTATGVDLGGVEKVSITSVDLKGKPLDLPDTCDVDVTDLAIDDFIKIGDLKIPENVELLADAEDVCVMIEPAPTGVAPVDPDDEDIVATSTEE